MSGFSLLTAVKLVAVLAAASILGNWFLSEFRRARAAGAPWYKPYLSPPGLLVLAALCLPLLIRWLAD